MPPPTEYDSQQQERWVAAIIATVLQYIVAAMSIFLAPTYTKEDLHTSALSGRAFVQELLTGHPDAIYITLGMRKHVFLALVLQIRLLGYIEPHQSRIDLDESLAIFLYTCVTGLSVDQVAMRFQHSKSTISEYVLLVILLTTDLQITQPFSKGP